MNDGETDRRTGVAYDALKIITYHTHTASGINLAGAVVPFRDRDTVKLLGVTLDSLLTSDDGPPRH